MAILFLDLIYPEVWFNWDLILIFMAGTGVPDTIIVIALLWASAIYTEAEWGQETGVISF
jgi:hypothetical protein